MPVKELQSILPEIPGWERNHPEAERMTSPVSFSYASSKYTKDNFEVTAKITDSEGSGMSDKKELQTFLARTDLNKQAVMK